MDGSALFFFGRDGQRIADDELQPVLARVLARVLAAA